MGLLGWLKRAPAEDRRLREWRNDWTRVAAAPDADRLAQLGTSLDALGLPDEDVEIEREMLDGLQERQALASTVRQSGLPVVDTGHRVVGAERCHLTTPASMPDEPGQPGGRLLLTSGRAIFVGGANGLAVAWHSVRDAQHVDRDVVIVRADRDQLYRFRCNTFGDALRGALIARELAGTHPRRRPGL